MEEHKLAEAFITDSYDLCPCGSGAKYKFCCKPIFKEITHAMSAAQKGKFKEAIEWMGKAREIMGEPRKYCADIPSSTRFSTRENLIDTSRNAYAWPQGIHGPIT